MIPPDLRELVPPLYQHIVHQVAGRGDLSQVVEPLGHEPGVEQPLGVGQRFLGVRAGFLEGLAGLAKKPSAPGVSRQLRYLATTTGERAGRTSICWSSRLAASWTASSVGPEARA